MIVSDDKNFWLRHKPGGDGVNFLCCALFLYIKFFLGYFCLYTHSFWSFPVSTVCHENNHSTQEWRYSANLVVVINTWEKGFCCRNKTWPNNREHHNRNSLLIVPFGIHKLAGNGLWDLVGFFVIGSYLLLWWPYQVYYSKCTTAVLSNGGRTLKNSWCHYWMWCTVDKSLISLQIVQSPLICHCISYSILVL